MKIARYGWVPQLPDHRDLQLAPRSGLTLPSSVDLRSSMPPIYDQGTLGSCTGNACAAILQFNRRMQGLQDFVPSRLMLYYDARKIEGTTGFDIGAQIRDVVKGAGVSGACPEDAWPYDPAAVTAAPSAAAYAAGLKDRALEYRAVPQSLDAFRQCLSLGEPIIFGFTVYESFESDDVARTGDMPMPNDREHVVGGHAVSAVGYDDGAQIILARNSWGADWGDGGYFRMPYDYITNANLASDFWDIRFAT
jgi:C1A family cysteine protease